jgi:hypothetical protein
MFMEPESEKKRDIPAPEERNMRYSKPNISILRSFRVLRYRGAISSFRDWV